MSSLRLLGAEWNGTAKRMPTPPPCSGSPPIPPRGDSAAVRVLGGGRARPVRTNGAESVRPPALRRRFGGLAAAASQVQQQQAMIRIAHACAPPMIFLPSTGSSTTHGQSDSSPTMYMGPTTMLSRSLSSTNFSPSAFSFLRRWAQALLHSFLFPLPPAALFSFLW